MVSVKNFHLRVAGRKFDVFKTNICPRREVSRRFYEYQISAWQLSADSSERNTLVSSFSSARYSHNHIIKHYFNFLDETAWKPNVKFEIENSCFSFFFYTPAYERGRISGSHSACLTCSSGEERAKTMLPQLYSTIWCDYCAFSSS